MGAQVYGPRDSFSRIQHRNSETMSCFAFVREIFNPFEGVCELQCELDRLRRETLEEEMRLTAEIEAIRERIRRRNDRIHIAERNGQPIDEDVLSEMSEETDIPLSEAETWS